MDEEKIREIEEKADRYYLSLAGVSSVSQLFGTFTYGSCPFSYDEDDCVLLF